MTRIERTLHKLATQYGETITRENSEVARFSHITISRIDGSNNLVVMNVTLCQPRPSCYRKERATLRFGCFLNNKKISKQLAFHWLGAMIREGKATA